MSTKISREVVNDIASGASNAEVCEKHGLDNAQVETIRRKLKAAGVIKDNGSPATSNGNTTQITTQSLWKCPACNTPQTRAYDECPQCGIIISKYKSALKVQLTEGDHLVVGERITDPEIQDYIKTKLLIPKSKILAAGMYNHNPDGEHFLLLQEGLETQLIFVKRTPAQIISSSHPLSSITRTSLTTVLEDAGESGVLEIAQGQKKLSCYFTLDLLDEMEELKNLIDQRMGAKEVSNRQEAVTKTDRTTVKSQIRKHEMTASEGVVVVIVAGVIILSGFFISDWWSGGHYFTGSSSSDAGYYGDSLVGKTYNNDVFNMLSAGGSYETLAGTGMHLWQAYFPNSNLTVTVDKKSNKIIDVDRGRAQ